jgi:UDP-N-acetylmuramyl pentapeptide phosphotransferase/UDP-N-acetylglucosamine-1-phosphate transferase
MFWVYTIVLMISAFLLSATCTWGMRELMKTMLPARQPNDRDNHQQPTPRGGGVAVMVSIIGFLSVVNIDGYVILGLIFLLLVSFADDISSLSRKLRFAVHLACAGLIATTINHTSFVGWLMHVPLLDVLHPYMHYVSVTVVAGILVWFMNIYNFMDGVDEISVLQTVTIALGVGGIAFIQPNISQNIGAESLIIIAGILGFWIFNRYPSSIFLGDSGSIPLGALLGWLLITLAAGGYWVPAVLIPAYYVVDATLTLMWRMVSGQAFWQAHSQHAYQTVVKGGRSHRAATIPIALINIVLLGLTYIAVTQPQYGLQTLVLGYGAALLLCMIFWVMPAKKPVVKADLPAQSLGSIELRSDEYEDVTAGNALS